MLLLSSNLLSCTYDYVSSPEDYVDNHLRSLDRQPNGIFVLGNHIEGNVDGLEAFMNYQITHSWLLDASTLLLDERFNGPNLAQSLPGNDPHSQWILRSKWNINSSQQLDILLRRVGKLPSPTVPAYRLLDIHFGWSISQDVELGITGRNLLDLYHQEFPSGGAQLALNPIQVERELDMALMVKF